mmetsp:Transcript_26031/g.89827  ORF Transcript_26031/g.89827 Transcript_26031/m.89827 type:complete len:592 (+) Transcript_26031:88-1863(+)
MMCAVHVPTAEVLALPAGASNASTVEVGVPRRVARSVCEAYLTECGGALRRGKDFLDASLYVDACEAWAPMDGQLAKSNVDLHLGSVPSFKARPNEVGNATLAPSELAVDCVYRTTPFPPDRDRRAVNHVHGTGCAFDCPLPLMTKADQTYFDKVKIVADVYVTLTMGFNVLTYTILPEKRQKTPSFLWVSIAIFLEDFFRRWSRYTNWDGIGGERQNFWCADKVTAWVQTDWSSACEIQSVLQLWVLAWRSGIVVGLGLDMYARAVLMSPDPIWYTTHLTLPVSTVLATLVTIGLTWAYPDRGIQTEIGKFRYEFCYYSPEVELGLNIYNTLTQLAAIYFMVRALVAIVSALNAVAAMKAPKLKRQMGHETSEQRGIAATTNKNVSQMYSSNVYMFKVPTIFIIILVGASQQLWRRADYRRVNSAKNIDRYEGWADCLLANSGLTEAMQSRVCGELPKAIYPDLEYHLSVAWFQFPWRVLLLLLFSLNKDSVKCWIQHYPWAGRFLRPLIQKGDIIDLVSTLIVVSLTYISSAMTSPFVKKTLSPIHAARTLSPFKGGHFFKGAKINACDGDTIALDVPSLSDGEIPGSR